jgi:two-component system NtrC family sensor kinase
MLEERQLRLLYSTSNQLSLHMERIMAVRAAEAGRFKSVVDSMPQGVLVSADGERVAHANRAASEMLTTAGTAPEDGLKTILERIGAEHFVLPLGDRPDPLPEYDVTVGAERVWNLTAAPFRGDGGRSGGVVLVIADVTDRRRMQEQLAQSEKMSSLGQMISGVAHELNNPLASILGYSQLLQMSGADSALSGKLDTLAKEAERCRKIVENLLSFARRRAPERVPLSLNQVVRNVVALMQYQLRVDDVSVDLELSRDLPVLHGDTHQLEQALVNLLTNARHAIRGTGAPGTVTVRTLSTPSGGVRLEVEDTGPGVAEADRSKIFDPFYTTKKLGEGTGLGLALVYGIVTDHGGTVDVRQGAPGGARFVVEFAVGRYREAATTLPVEAPLDSGAAGRILIVDDEGPLAKMISDVLVGDGHRTTVFLDARRALEHLESESYDLVISDLKMPGMKGDELHAELKRMRPELAENVLLTTGDTLGEEPGEIVARTGLELLRKPFDLDELRRRVRARLAPRKPRP